MKKYIDYDLNKILDQFKPWYQNEPGAVEDNIVFSKGSFDTAEPLSEHQKKSAREEAIDNSNRTTFVADFNEIDPTLANFSLKPDTLTAFPKKVRLEPFLWEYERNPGMRRWAYTCLLP